ncbi:MAG: Asp23/Gls24 family envelope stress response protein [Opitutales bacterium]|nr:Asp23/Gls24 family envelope stress response protein [Opitutales bacterium]
MTKKKNNPDIEDSVPRLSDESAGLGTIRINHSVIAGIVRLATQSVTGVINVGGAGVVEGLTDFFSKKESERGVNVTECEDGGYEIEVRVVLKFGVDLAKTGTQVQDAIREQILSMTGNHAKIINVVIDDIKQESLDPDEDPEDSWTGPASD